MSRWWYGFPDESSCGRNWGKKRQWMPSFFAPNISVRTFGLGLASWFVNATWASFHADSNLYKQSLQHEQLVNSRLFFYVDRFFQIPCIIFYGLFLYMDRFYSTMHDILHCSCMWTRSSNSIHNILQSVLVYGQVLPIPCMLQFVLVCGQILPIPCITFYRLLSSVDGFFQVCTSHNSWNLDQGTRLFFLREKYGVISWNCDMKLLDERLFVSVSDALWEEWREFTNWSH